MIRTSILLLLLFLLTLGAGGVLGMMLARPPVAATAPRGGASQSPLGAELGLSQEQSARMHDIWEGVRDKVDNCFLRARALQDRRDRALFALLSAEQRAQYAREQQTYADAVAALKAERDAMFQKGVQRTEQILDPAQRRKYRQILNARLVQDAANSPPDWIAPPAAGR
jgi:hypothetical protein